MLRKGQIAALLDILGSKLQELESLPEPYTHRRTNSGYFKLLDETFNTLVDMYETAPERI